MDKDKPLYGYLEVYYLLYRISSARFNSTV